MDSPFRSWYEKPTQQRRSYSHHPSLFGLPVYPVDPTRETLKSAYADRQPPAEKKSGRKVVQIPVQFFGSDSSDSDRRSESALRIQKVFRGFFVRKSVRKIKEIKSQVDEIEVRLLRDEVVEMIRRNEKERLRMSESLMNLLLKLDGVRGIDLGIRVYRKSVTRKAIILQEKIDAICAPDSEGNDDDNVEIGSQELKDGVAAELEGYRIENSKNSIDFKEMLNDSGEESFSVPRECSKMEVEKDYVHTEELDAAVASKVNPIEESSKNIDFGEEKMDSVKEMLFLNNGKDMINGAGKEDDVIGNYEFLANSDLDEILGDVREEHEGGKDVEVEEESLEVERNHLDTELVDVLGTSVVEVTPETCSVQGTGKNLDFDGSNAETVKEVLAYSDDHGEKSCAMSEESKCGDSLRVEDKTMEVEGDCLDAEKQDGAETMMDTLVERNGGDMAIMEKGDLHEDLNKRKCELVEQMMEVNKKMMAMMTQLYERNEMQFQMLDALANRVELLEKAYLCDKHRNRRKKMKKNKCARTCIED